ncbi:unnamed protein product [Rotaria sp. Silwood1]|nr:unnamed protein product [Rotaria sp. Silwood1]
MLPKITGNHRWAQNGVTVAGNHEWGDNTNQLQLPEGLFVNNDQTMVIADFGNHRIIEWKVGNKHGQLVAGGSSKENPSDQLKWPTDVLIDKETDSLIICDQGNRRVKMDAIKAGIEKTKEATEEKKVDTKLQKSTDPNVKPSERMDAQFEADKAAAKAAEHHSKAEQLKNKHAHS